LEATRKSHVDVIEWPSKPEKLAYTFRKTSWARSAASSGFLVYL